MQLKELKIKGFRCYESLDIFFNHRINVFSGANGAGKTSVLEAIYFISTGKSFRSKRNRNLIRHECEQLTVFANFNGTDNQRNKIGINLSKSLNKSIKRNGQVLTNQSEIAHVFPVVSMDPDSYLFLDKPPQYRRSFLDWLVFHVEPSYLEIWSKVARCQKQLNILYKNKQQKQLKHWQDLYLRYAMDLTMMREQVFVSLHELIIPKINEIIPELNGLDISFFQGWAKDYTLEQQLEKDADKNFQYGSLLQGVHKMDIRTTINKKVAHENLSRGQKKLISIIFYLSYIELISIQLNSNLILCLDDMDAELDMDKTKIITDLINNSQHQVFITTVDSNKLKTVLPDACMFHVEHDRIMQISE